VPKLESTRYTILFATAVCVVCALLVAASAVGLRDRQENNQLVYRQKNVLLAAGLVKPDEKLSDRELQAIFDKNIVVRLIDLKTGVMIPEGKIDARSFDQKKARNDPAQSRAAPPHAGTGPHDPRGGNTPPPVAGNGAAPKSFGAPVCRNRSAGTGRRGCPSDP